MGYVGTEMEDMLIQKAYAKLKKRGYKLPLNSCYWIMLGILQREGEMALDNYIETVEI